MKVGDYIHEEKNFTYQVLVSLDGANWVLAASMDVGQTITIKYKTTTGNASNDWQGIPDLPGGNTFPQGAINPVVTLDKVRGIVGNVPINIAGDANQ